MLFLFIENQFNHLKLKCMPGSNPIGVPRPGKPLAEPAPKPKPTKPKK